MDTDAHERAAQARKGSPYLTRKEAAHFLRRTPKTLKNWRSIGYGPKVSANGYHIDDLEAWEKADREKRKVQRGIRHEEPSAPS